MSDDLYWEGYNILEIARRLDCSHASITRELRRKHRAEGSYRPETVRRSRTQMGKLMA